MYSNFNYLKISYGKVKRKRKDLSSYMLEYVCILYLGVCRLFWGFYISMGSIVLLIDRYKKSEVGV